jgi:hypothetical protein
MLNNQRVIPIQNHYWKLCFNGGLLWSHGDIFLGADKDAYLGGQGRSEHAPE